MMDGKYYVLSLFSLLSTSIRACSILISWNNFFASPRFTLFVSASSNFSVNESNWFLRELISGCNSIVFITDKLLVFLSIPKLSQI